MPPWFPRGGNEIEVEDTIFARFEGNVPFTFLGTNTSMADMPFEVSLHLSDHTVMTVLPSTVLINSVPVPSATARRPSYGKERYGSGHEGARVIRLILAAYESASTNKQVKIK